MPTGYRGALGDHPRRDRPVSAEGPSRELLESVHEFPGPYTLKAFGPHTQAFVDGIRGAAVAVHTGPDEPNVSARASSKGNHICVTVTVEVTDADGVYALYAGVKAVDGLSMLL